MIGLRTAKALIVDDVAVEAMPMITALGALGVGTVYHDADPTADYSVKNSGLRLLILDMVLANRGATDGDPTTAMGILIGALMELVDDGPGIVLVVCWTKHPDVKDLFAEAFRKTFPNIQLMDVLLFEKQTLSAPAERQRLIDKIRKALEEYDPANLFLHFEQLAHQSASKTVGLLCDVARRFANGDTTRWPEGVYAICSALALAERGSRLAFESPIIGRAALIDALAPLLADSIEHDEVVGAELSESISKKLAETCKREVDLWASRDSLLSLSVRAELNSKLNISHTVHTGMLCPGTTYFVKPASDNFKTVSQFLPSLSEVIDDTFYRLEGRLQNGHVPCLIEISPPCDFAQAKGKVPKFLTGFLVSLPESTEAKTGDHIRHIGPLRLSVLDSPENDYQIVVNAHYTITLKSKVAAKLTPTFRLRSAALADFLSWHSALTSRPGFLRLGP